MKRRSLLTGAAVLAAAPLAAPHAQQPVTVRWWYHLDDPTASPAALVADFEKANPDIKVQAESIPWGGGADYDTRLYTALIAGNAPDCAMLKFLNQPRLMEMEALKPLDGMTRIAAGRRAADISERSVAADPRLGRQDATTCRCNTWCFTCMCARTGSPRRTWPCRPLSTSSSPPRRP